MQDVNIGQLTEDQVDNVIFMAWSDRISFEQIEERTGFSEAAVIKIMRAKLKRKSFNIWRKRVSGRTTKHRKRFRSERAHLKSFNHSTSSTDHPLETS